jgi:hypothetical protein
MLDLQPHKLKLPTPTPLRVIPAAEQAERMRRFRLDVERNRLANESRRIDRLLTLHQAKRPTNGSVAAWRAYLATLE